MNASGIMTGDRDEHLHEAVAQRVEEGRVGEDASEVAPAREARRVDESAPVEERDDEHARERPDGEEQVPRERGGR